MDSEIEGLRKCLANAEAVALEERRRREVAEELLQPQTLESYLESCHRLSLAIKPVTDRSLTTQGETTNPTGRFTLDELSRGKTFQQSRR